MSPPQRHVPVCICGDSSPMSPTLTTSVLHSTRAGPVCTRWGSSPIHPRAPGLFSSPPLSAPAPPSRCAISRPSLHGADSSTSCSVYSLSGSTASALREQQNPFFLKCGGFLSYSPLECQGL